MLVVNEYVELSERREEGGCLNFYFVVDDNVLFLCVVIKVVGKDVGRVGGGVVVFVMGGDCDGVDIISLVCR